MKIELVIGVAFIGIFIVLVAISLSSQPGCKKRDSAQREEFSGVVLRAFFDSKHHNSETIEYHNESRPRQTTLFVLEQSGIFQFIQPGDSLSKVSGELSVTIIRGTKTYHLPLSYDCPSK